MTKPRSINVGGIFYNNKRQQAEVLEYRNPVEILIRFSETGYETVVQASNLRRGVFKDYLTKSAYGVGYLGANGSKYTGGKANSPAHRTWRAMMKRCYSEEYTLVNPTYRGCYVQREWHDFGVFILWYLDNCPSARNGVKFQLDKDILSNDGKKYSEDTCCFVPDYINSLLITGARMRGLCPIGVSLNTKLGKYVARLNIRGKSRQLGLFPTSQEAFLAYKKAKEAHVKEVALEALNKGHIDRRVYEALFKFEVMDDTI